MRNPSLTATDYQVLTTVYSLMAFEVADFGKTVATCGTDVGSTPQVDAVMTDQTWMVKESLWAVGALM